LTPQGALDPSFDPSGTTPGVVEVDFSNEAAYPGGADVEARDVAVVGGDAIVALGVIAPNRASDTTIGLVRLARDRPYHPVPARAARSCPARGGGGPGCAATPRRTPRRWRSTDRAACSSRDRSSARAARRRSWRASAPPACWTAAASTPATPATRAS